MSAAHPTPPALHRVRVWDLPTRAFHWVLAAVTVAALVTGSIGGAAMVWHLRLGQAVLALLVFRLLWGLVGGRWSRFSAVRQAVDSASAPGQGGPAQPTGHSLLGWLSVLGLLLVLSLQLGTGLVSNDDIAFAGPLSHLVSNDTVAAATGFHRQWGKLLVLGWVALHLLAIAWYSLRGRPLVGAMVHGDKQLSDPAPPSRDDIRSRLLAAVLLAASLAVGAWVFSLTPAGF